MNNKVLTLLGFAAKSGNLSYGFEATLTAIKQKKAKTVLTACDLSDKSLKEIAYFCKTFEIQHIMLEDIDIFTLTNAVGRKCGIVSVNDKGFSDALGKANIVGGNANDK